MQTLVTLIIWCDEIGTQGAQYLANALEQNKVILLVLPHSSSSSSLNHVDTRDICSYEQSNWCRRNAIPSKGFPTKQSNMTDIARAYSQLFSRYFLQTLTTVDLSHNKMGAQGAQYLANALEQNEVSSVELFFF